MGSATAAAASQSHLSHKTFETFLLPLFLWSKKIVTSPTRNATVSCDKVPLLSAEKIFLPLSSPNPEQRK